MATNEAGDGPGPRGQRRIVSADTAEEAIALGPSWVAGAAPKPQAGSSDRDAAIELLSDRDLWSAIMWFARRREMKHQICDGLVIFEAPRMAYSVLGTIRPRAAAAPVALSLGNGGSHLSSCQAVDDTSQVCLACFYIRNTPHRVGRTPKIE